MNKTSFSHYLAMDISHVTDINDIYRALVHREQDFVPSLQCRQEFPGQLERIARLGGAYTIGDREMTAMVTYVSYFDGQDIDEGSVYVPYIFTDSAHRGSGHMTALLGHCVRQFRHRLFDRVCLETWSTNGPARALFHRLGFVETTVRKDARAPGVDDIKMELSLQCL